MVICIQLLQPAPDKTNILLFKNIFKLYHILL